MCKYAYTRVMESLNTVQQACSTALSSHLNADFFKALGDETRLTIVLRLATASEPLTVSEVGTCCGTHLSGVSRHLAFLERAGIVSSRKEGREVFYRLNHAILADHFTELVAAFSACERYCCQ